MKWYVCLNILFSFALVSCVGTVEDVAKDKTITEEVETSDVQFAGVDSLRAISHDKIEVYFNPAEGGSGKYSYKIFYGGNPTPAVTASDVLNTDDNGKLMFTLVDLDSAKNYIIRVDVADQVTGNYTRTTEVLRSTTFSNRVASFLGISQVSNLSGVDGVDSIRVRWIHAECIDSLFCNQDSDPVSYEIILLDRSQGLTIASVDDRSILPSEGRLVKIVNYDDSINESVVRGLKSDTEYYVFVRAIHKASIDDINQVNLRGESNRRYIKIKTLSSDQGNIDFDTNSVLVENFSGEDSVNSLKISWDAAQGVFDHYRVYYAHEDASLNAASLTDSCKQSFASGDNLRTTILCKKVLFSEDETQITGLLAQEDYDILLVLCQTTSCESDDRIIAELRSRNVSGGAPVFSGISSVETVSDVNKLDALRINYVPLNVADVYFDGYKIEFKDDSSISENEPDCEILLDNNPGCGVGNIFYESYNYLSASSIIIRGIEYYDSTKTYCFRMFPFIFDADGTKVEYKNDNWQCVTNLVYSTPTNLQFKGLRSTTTQDGQVTLRWDLPSQGLYEKLELYYSKSTSNQPLFGTMPGDLDRDGRNSVSDGVNVNYGRIIIDPQQTSITLTDIPDGHIYSFGILSTYNSVNGSIRSEINTNIVTCTFDDSMQRDCTGGE